MNKEIFQAAQANDITKLKRLLEINPSLANKESEDGLTPLGFAAHYGNKDAVQILLEYGAEVNVVSHSKIEFIPSNTALHAAIAGERNIEVIKLLLHNNAKTTISDSNYHTSLHTAAFHGDNTEIISLLIEEGADVNIKTKDGKTALDIAAEQRNYRVAQLLQQNN